MGFFPIQVGIQRRDELRKLGIKAITSAKVDPLELGNRFWDVIVRNGLIEDRNYPLVVERGVIDFSSSVG